MKLILIYFSIFLIAGSSSFSFADSDGAKALTPSDSGLFEVVKNEPARLQCALKSGELMEREERSKYLVAIDGCYIDLELISSSKNVPLSKTQKIKIEYKVYAKGDDCKIKQASQVNLSLKCDACDNLHLVNCKVGEKVELINLSKKPSFHEMACSTRYHCSIKH